MKNQKFCDLIKSCGKKISRTMSFEEGLKCYLDVMYNDLDLLDITYVIYNKDRIAQVFSHNSLLVHEILEGELDYLLRNPDVEYKKTVHSEEVQYLYKLTNDNFIIFVSRKCDDDLLLSPIFIALIQNLFFNYHYLFKLNTENQMLINQLSKEADCHPLIK